MLPTFWMIKSREPYHIIYERSQAYYKRKYSCSSIVKNIGYAVDQYFLAHHFLIPPIKFSPPFQEGEWGRRDSNPRPPALKGRRANQAAPHPLRDYFFFPFFPFFRLLRKSGILSLINFIV